MNLSGNSISTVWREGDVIFKRQPKYLADNEEYALVTLGEAGYAPRFIERVDDETIKMEYIDSEMVTNPRLFMSFLGKTLMAISMAGLRHGDLTEYAVLVKDQRPMIIDWAESRWIMDARPDKRPGGDRFWLKQTMEKLCQQ